MTYQVADTHAQLCSRSSGWHTDLKLVRLNVGGWKWQTATWLRRHPPLVPGSGSPNSSNTNCSRCSMLPRIVRFMAMQKSLNCTRWSPSWRQARTPTRWGGSCCISLTCTARARQDCIVCREGGGWVV